MDGRRIWEVPANIRRLSFILIAIPLVNFVIAGSFAPLMRTDQAGVPATSAQTFYQLLTAHGLVQMKSAAKELRKMHLSILTP